MRLGAKTRFNGRVASCAFGNELELAPRIPYLVLPLLYLVAAKLRNKTT